MRKLHQTWLRGAVLDRCRWGASDFGKMSHVLPRWQWWWQGKNLLIPNTSIGRFDITMLDYRQVSNLPQFKTTRFANLSSLGTWNLSSWVEVFPPLILDDSIPLMSPTQWQFHVNKQKQNPSFVISENTSNDRHWRSCHVPSFSQGPNAYRASQHK